MPGGSPTAYLLWSILSTLFFTCQLIHLWIYDKFQCLRWNQTGRQPGAFKRFMSYTYLATLICLVCFAVAFTTLKFQEGYMTTSNGQITPVPLEYYSPQHKKWVLPLLFIFSIAWGCELVTHLEEFTFWLFLQNQGPTARLWFQSGEFRLWLLGTVLALVGMPITTFISRRQLDSCLAWTLLVGSSVSTVTSLAFLYVLSRFPAFIRRVKVDGAAPDVVLRLVFFHQLNIGRIIYRFLYSVPLFVLSLDGVQGRHSINNSAFWPGESYRHASRRNKDRRWSWLDLLLMIGALGSFVSSAVTLLIFFPRSLTQELGYTVVPVIKSPTMLSVHSNLSQRPASSKDHVMPIFRPPSAQLSTDSSHDVAFDYELDGPPSVTDPYLLGGNVETPESYVLCQRSSGLVRSRSEGHGTVLHPYVRVFRSPIDISDAEVLDNLPESWRRLTIPGT